MQLVALKYISARLPLGATFEERDDRARILIALGVAKPADDPEEPKRRTYTRRDLQSEP